MSAARVLVVTVVHDPRDARIYERQIRALLDAGDQITFAAPFSGYGVHPPHDVTAEDLPRASGRSRAVAIVEARRLLRRLGPQHDAVILHDPELLVAAAGFRHRVLVWDVHEDTAAALSLKAWLPESARPLVRRGVAALESCAERHRRLLLAEPGYSVRFRSAHPVVPNTSRVPSSVTPPDTRQAVYLGRVSVERGGLDLVEVGRLLVPHGCSLVIMGPADERMRPHLESARDAGWIDWNGFVDNDRALSRVEGSVAGLSLLHDEPNYRHSMPTKVIEYMARGIPVITTPLPRAVELVQAAESGLVVPFNDPRAAAYAVVSLLGDAALRHRLGSFGHRYASENTNWDVDGPAFVELLHRWISEAAESRG